MNVTLGLLGVLYVVVVIPLALPIFVFMCLMYGFAGLMQWIAYLRWKRHSS